MRVIAEHFLQIGQASRADSSRGRVSLLLGERGSLGRLPFTAVFGNSLGRTSRPSSGGDGATRGRSPRASGSFRGGWPFPLFLFFDFLMGGKTGGWSPRAFTGFVRTELGFPQPLTGRGSGGWRS